MKRFYVILFIAILIVCLCSTAFADEILFRGVQWGSNPAEARKQIDEPKVYMQREYNNGSIAYPEKTAERLIDQSKNYWYGNYEFFSQHEVLTRYCSVYIKNNPTVGGYKISTLNMYFANDIKDGKIIDGDNALHFAMAEYSFDILDGKSAYADLSTKLATLYGAGIEVKNTYNSGLWYDGKQHGYTQNDSIVTFSGDNGTHVMLSCLETVYDEDPDHPGCFFSLTYWCDRYVELIREMDEILIQEEYDAQLQQEQNVSQNDFGGL